MGWGGGGMCTYMNKCFKWHFYSSRRTPVQNYFEIHAYIKSYGPEKLIYVTFKCDLDLQPTFKMFQMALLLFKDNSCVK